MLKIHLPKLFYTAGEPILGEISFRLSKLKHVKYVMVGLKGYEHTEWRDPDSQAIHTDRAALHEPLTQNRRRRPLVDETSTLFPLDSDWKMTKGEKLEAGEHKWPFTFNVPENSPPTVSYKDGKVRIVYKLKCVANPQWGRKIVMRQVIRIGILYALDPSQPPRQHLASKSFLLASSDAPVSMKVQLDKEVTFPGDEINASLEITNKSSKTIQGVSAKIKRIISFGPRKDKTEVFKLDKKIKVLENSQWTGSIPINIPQLESWPTVTNAGLITIKYVLVLRLKATLAKSLPVEIPLTISIFPPLSYQSQNQYKIQLPPSYSPPMMQEEKKDEDLKVVPITVTEEEKEVKYPTKVVPGEIIWQSDNTPCLAPSAVPQAIQIESAMEEVDSVIKDIDCSVFYAHVGELEEVSDVGPDETYQGCQEKLIYATRHLASEKEKFVGISRRSIDGDFGQSVKGISNSIYEVGYHTKKTSSLIGDTTSQLRMLGSAKTVSLASQQLLLSGQSFYTDPKDESANRMLSTASQNIDKEIQGLMKSSKGTMSETITKHQEANNCKATLQNLLLEFGNPFFEPEKVIFKDLEETYKSLYRHVAHTITICNTEQEETSLELKSITHKAKKWMTQVKAASRETRDESIKHQVTICESQFVHEIGKFIDAVVHRSGKSGEANAEAQQLLLSSSATLGQSMSMMLDVAAASMQATPTRKKKRLSTSHDAALNDLVTILKEVEQSRASILSSGSSSAFPLLGEKKAETILASSSSITKLTADLMALAIECEKERLRSDEVSYQSSAQHGLTNAVMKVSKAIKQLAAAANAAVRGKTELETLEVCAKNVTATTAQLVTASFSFAPIHYRGKLSELVKAIAYNAAQLMTSATKNISLERDMEGEDSDGKDGDEEGEDSEGNDEGDVPFSFTSKVQEMEQQVRVIKLEKELEKARQGLAGIRKEEYASAKRRTSSSADLLH